MNDPKPLKRWNITIRAIHLYDIPRTFLSVSSNMAPFKYLWYFTSIYFLRMYIPRTPRTSSFSRYNHDRFPIARDPGTPVSLPPKINDSKPLKRWNITIRAIYLFGIHRTFLSVSSNMAPLKYLWCFNSIYFLPMCIPRTIPTGVNMVSTSRFAWYHRRRKLICFYLWNLYLPHEGDGENIMFAILK